MGVRRMLTAGDGPLSHHAQIPTQRIWHREPWSWLFSIKVGVSLLAALAAASVVGTTIAPLEKAQALVFYTGWYRALLALMGVNLACATFRTIVEKILPSSAANFRSSPRFYASHTPTAVFPFRGPIEAAAAAFQRRGYKTGISGTCACAAKGGLSRWGAPVSHLGALLVLLGGFASAWTAREGVVQFCEGETASSMASRDAPETGVPLGFSARCEDFETANFPGTSIPSKFVSTVTVFDATGAPAFTAPVEVNRSFKYNGWAFHQTGYQEERGEVRQLLAVWHPDLKTTATMELSPGQSRPIPGVVGAELTLEKDWPLKWTIAQDSRQVFGRLAQENAGNLSVRVLQFEPDFIMGPDHQFTSRSAEPNNPAIHAGLFSGGQQIAEQWLFSRKDLQGSMHVDGHAFDMRFLALEGTAGAWRFRIGVSAASDPARRSEALASLGQAVALDFGAGKDAAKQGTSPGGETKTGPSDPRVRLIKTVPAYSTTLTLTRNPAIPFIYAGCGVMMLGLLLSFFVRRTEIWMLFDKRAGTLSVAAQRRFAMARMDPGIERIIEGIRGEGAPATETSGPSARRFASEATAPAGR